MICRSNLLLIVLDLKQPHDTCQAEVTPCSDVHILLIIYTAYKCFLPSHKKKGFLPYFHDVDLNQFSFCATKNILFDICLYLNPAKKKN